MLAAALLLLSLSFANSAVADAPAESFQSIAKAADQAREADRLSDAIDLYSKAVRLRPAWADGWWWLGSIFYEQDRFSEAEGPFRRYIALSPKPAPAYAFLALCEYETRDYSAARHHFDLWSKAGSPGNEALLDVAGYHWALLLTRAGRFNEALVLLAAKAQKLGQTPALTEAMGLASLRMAFLPEDYPQERREAVWLAGMAAFYCLKGDFPRSDDSADRLLQHHGQEPNVHYFRGTLLRSQQKLDAAAEEFQKEPQISPHHAPVLTTPSTQHSPAPPPPSSSDFAALSEAADKAREENRDDDAVRLYRQALTLQPAWKPGLWFLGMLLYDKDQYAEVRDLMRRFVALEPQAGAGWALLGMSEFQTRDYSRSLDHLQHSRTLALGDNKEMAQAIFYHVAVLQTRFEQYDDAMALLMGMRKSGSSADLLSEPLGLAALRYPLLPAEIPPDRKEMFRIAGQAALADESQKRDEAEKLLTGMTAAYPNEPGVHFFYGVFLLNARPEDGIRELKRELEIAPFNLTAKLRLADQYLKEQQLDEALRLANEVVKLDPANASGFLVSGETLVAKGEMERGILALETARKLRPATVRTHWDLLRAYTSAGRVEDAKREKEEIEKLRRPDAP